jgi:hypothetical protein
MAKLTRANYDSIRDHLFERAHRTGEQIKNDFPNILRIAIEREAWKQFIKPDGTKFKNLVEWLHYQFPIGVSMGQGRYVISYPDALQLTKETAPDVHRVLLENAPHRETGRPVNNETSTSHLVPRHDRSTSATVLSVRLAQEKPKYYEAYLRGDYKSVTAAAIAAGLLKNDANLRRAKSAISKLTVQENEELSEWIQDNGKKLWNAIGKLFQPQGANGERKPRR